MVTVTVWKPLDRVRKQNISLFCPRLRTLVKKLKNMQRNAIHNYDNFNLILRLESIYMNRFEIGFEIGPAISKLEI